jgi:hypothetical protein
VGGFPSNTAEIYDPVAGTFTAIPNMAYARACHTATLMANGMVLIAGGVYQTSSGTRIVRNSTIHRATPSPKQQR